MNEGPDAQALLSLFFVDLTCQVYAVLGKREVAVNGLELTLVKFRPPGES